MKRVLLGVLAVAGIAGLVMLAIGEVHRSARVWYVDSSMGNDDNPGTIEAPLKSMAAVNSIIWRLGPGAAILFRRDGVWDGVKLDITDVHGTKEDQIIIGAWGEGRQRPSLRGNIRVLESSHMEIRDLDINGSSSGPCLAFKNGSHHVSVVNNSIHDCKNNGVAFHDGVHHTVTMSNAIFDIHGNDGVSVHDANWKDPPLATGDHHWIVDNVFPGNYHEDAIDVASEEAIDIKVIGNRIRGARQAGIVVGHQGRYVWILGNTITASASKRSGSLRLGAWDAPSSPGHYQVRGNVVFNNGHPIRAQAAAIAFENNTVIEPGIEGLIIDKLASGAVIRRNLFLRSPSNAIAAVDDQMSKRVAKMNFNWIGNNACGFEVASATLSLYQWRDAYGHDYGTRCSSDVPGVSLPRVVTDPANWDAAFFANFVPSPDWPGCALAGAPVGAYNCDGDRVGLSIKPFSELSDNGGYGWAGSPAVRRRYPLGGSSRTAAE